MASFVVTPGPVARALAAVRPGDLLPANDPGLLPEARRPALWNPRLTSEALDLARKATADPEPVLPFRAFRRFFDDGDRQEYEAAYFGRRRRLQALGLAVLSGRADDLLPALENRLWAVAEETTWALPAHLTGPLDRTTVDLFAAETASALTEIRCLLAGRLDPDLDQKLAAEVEARVLGPYRADRAPWGWESADHNWAAVCGGGIGLAALWCLEPAETVRVLARLGPTLDAYLSGFSDEGLCLEGMGYWTYGFGYFTAFAELLADRTGGRTDLWTLPELTPKLRRIAAFPAVGRLGAASFARFSDAPQDYRFPPGTCARLTSRLGEPRGLDPALAETLADDRYARWVRHLRDLCWTPAAPAPAATSPASNDAGGGEASWFPGAQWLFVRGTAGQLPAGLAAKGGHNGEPHNHNDLGSFLLAVGVDVFVDDLGAGRYDRDSFRERRYEAFVNRSAGHSVPLVGGAEQAPGAEHRTWAEYRPAGAGGPELDLDLTAAYRAAAGLTTLKRAFRWAPGKVFPMSVADSWTFSGAEEAFTSRLITRLPVTATLNGATIAGTEGRLEVVCDPPLPATITAVTYPAHEGPDETAFCVDFVLPAAARAVVLTLTHHPHHRSPA